MKAKQQRVPRAHVERLMENLRRFRRNLDRFAKPKDVNQLLEIFSRVSIEKGYSLDYLVMGAGSRAWIWPYARRGEIDEPSAPPSRLAVLPRDELAGRRGSESVKEIEVETLYRRLDYEANPSGLFEYALFVSELWAMKSEAVDSEWPEVDLIFSKRAFDAAVRKSERIMRITRPLSYDASARLASGGGGEVLAYAHLGGAWKRISQLMFKVHPNGLVDRTETNVLVNLA
jgi:hypothetical protein